MEIEKQIAKTVRERRAVLGLSLDALSERTGIAKSHLWQIEKGRSKNPTISTVYFLCDALGCSFSDLTGWNTAQSQVTPDEMALVMRHREIFGR